MRDCRSYGAREYFVFGMRFYFGLWLLYAGLMKWISIGPTNFVGFITSSFDKTWSPHALNVFLAWLIMVAEVALSVWVLSGIRPRRAWSFMSLLMFLLTVGQSILMAPTVADNWFFTIVTLACAALSDPEPAVATA